MVESIYAKKILIVDDDMSIVNMMDVVLKKEQFRKIYRAGSGVEAVKMTKEIEPDLIILDIMLPDLDGYEVCKQIRIFSMVPIIFLSAKTEESDKLVSFAVGGDEYLTKPFSTRELVARIQVTLRRQAYYETQIQEETEYDFGSGFCLNLHSKTLKKYEKIIPLTPKEYALLEYMVRNPAIVLTKEFLVQEIWESSNIGFDNTIMVHIRRLREKIEEDSSKPELIRTIKGRGYYFDSKVECRKKIVYKG